MGKRKNGTHSKGNPLVCFRDGDDLREKVDKARKKSGENMSAFIRRILNKEADKILSD